MPESQVATAGNLAEEAALGEGVETEVPAAPVAVKRPFRIDEQLHIFFARTIYPELLRRTVPLNGTRIYIYPVEDPRMFRCLYTAFSSGKKKAWKSVTGSDYRFYPEFSKMADGYLIRVRMKDATDQPVINWLYRYRHELDREGKHCELLIQFVSEFGEETYQELQANVKRLLDTVDRIYPRPGTEGAVAAVAAE